MNGGRFDIALPKRGAWFYEPKDNGWRSLDHAPTGAMFNRHGERLTIADEFKDALDLLRAAPFEWPDTEALERRHAIAQGTLIVLDVIEPGTYLKRRARMESEFPIAPLEPMELKGNSVYLIPSFPASEAAALWAKLKEINTRLGVEFYEGLVAKRADSIYPMQLRSSKQETPHWIKHRWEF
jgi:hypothetical protein